MNNKTSSKGGYRKKRKKFYNVYFCMLCAVEHQKKYPGHVLSVSQRRAGSFDRLIKLMRHPKLNCLTRELHDQIKFKCLPPQDEDSDVLIQKNAASEEENTHVNMSAMGKVDATELIKNDPSSFTEQPSGWCQSKIQYNKDDQSSQCMRTVVHKLL